MWQRYKTSSLLNLASVYLGISVWSPEQCKVSLGDHFVQLFCSVILGRIKLQWVNRNELNQIKEKLVNWYIHNPLI